MGSVDEVEAEGADEPGLGAGLLREMMPPSAGAEAGLVCSLVVAPTALFTGAGAGAELVFSLVVAPTGLFTGVGAGAGLVFSLVVAPTGLFTGVGAGPGGGTGSVFAFANTVGGC